MEEVEKYLLANDFTKVDDAHYENEHCSVRWNSFGYEVSDNLNLTMYSHDFSIYWLIGVLIYYGFVNEINV